ncbi:FHA domain-containing protein FhaB/FipA [Candidatus Rhodoluna planktonica]|uniref:FHA domain-containing protein n=1 Tax=Candidatus Rhodoluna planktonica TaxID=535712 RepID=A0A1D9E0S4_9MICO|nr:FHA domain-containing protein [Candidatus Rhodoluna planktonica]AOY56620.1 hypothetical protein A4Z71_06695 [Candidatus Rhodoluna planktonica]
MSELALFIVRTGFLAVLWIFVFSIISVIRSDLFGQRVVSRVVDANAPQVVSAPITPAAPAGLISEPSGSSATKLVVIEGDRSGQTIKLDRREITIGRSESNDLVVDDEYASTLHAKLVLINNDWLIQDLNSTNGTFLDGSKVGTPAVVKLNTPVRVGKTVFELRA